MNKNLYEKISKWIFPLILVFLALYGINHGIDLKDTGYNAGNYGELETLDRMWYYSTFLSNMAGWVLVHLPGGKCLLGLNFYTALIKAGFSLFSYFFFIKETEISRGTAFLANVISLGLWWIPNAGLYHYLSFLFMCIGAALIYRGLTSEKNRYFVIAGIVLALNILVRFPNVTNMALIVIVWWYSLLKKEKFGLCVKKTLYCMAGYLGTVAVSVLLLVITGELSTYTESIKALFTMSDEASKYGLKFMLVNLVNSYTCVKTWMVPVAALFVLCLIPGFIKTGGKLKTLFYVLSAVAAAGAYFWEFRLELFYFDFASYTSMYLFSVVMLVCTLFILCFGAFNVRFDIETRTLCAMALAIQFITPLGTNNSLYAVINNLFFILPVMLYVLVKLTGLKHCTYLHAGLMALVLFWALHAVLFRFEFNFSESGTSKLKYEVSGNAVLNGMKTGESRAALLNDLQKLWDDYGLSEYLLVSYGDIAGLSYYYGSEPALSTTWPSLDSFVSDRFANELAGLEKRMALGERVAVAADGRLDDEGTKQEILKKFLEENKFSLIYDNGIKIWISEE